MLSVDDRREHTRYSAHHLKVLVKSLRTNTGEWEEGKISAVDYNRFGVALETDYPFVVGDVLSLIIRTDDSAISEVTGIVCNRSKTEQGFRFGVHFEYEGADDNNNEANELITMEKQAAQLTH